MADGFERFVEEHYQAAYRFALSLCGHPEDAGDLTQQAFAIAQQKLHQVRDETKQKSWLFTVLRREFLHRSRDHSRQNHYPLELVEGELPPITVDHAAGMDARSLLAVLQGLEENFRVPLSLFYFEQLSYKEIAVIMETPLGTVMSRLARGKQQLRQRLEQTRSQATAGEHKIIPLTGGSSQSQHG